MSEDLRQLLEDLEYSYSKAYEEVYSVLPKSAYAILDDAIYSTIYNGTNKILENWKEQFTSMHFIDIINPEVTKKNIEFYTYNLKKIFKETFGLDILIRTKSSINKYKISDNVVKMQIDCNIFHMDFKLVPTTPRAKYYNLTKQQKTSCKLTHLNYYSTNLYDHHINIKAIPKKLSAEEFLDYLLKYFLQYPDQILSEELGNFEIGKIFTIEKYFTPILEKNKALITEILGKYWESNLEYLHFIFNGSNPMDFTILTLFKWFIEIVIVEDIAMSKKPQNYRNSDLSFRW